ncbi:MAG: cation diffusion facilitator family transporter [Chloroflexi bacterium]|nr:cation diffusion facilitator family transporter [Chloroflexota bacterium]
MKNMSPDRSKLTRFAWLSIAVALLTIGLKTSAYLLTNSVGLLSDALESIVNLIGALMALGMLTIAARPADENHTYGHSKAEYFSSGVEGTLILLAAISIAYTAIERLMSPKPLEQIGIGLIISVAASLANLGVALILKKAGKQYHSISLTSNSHHLMTDVWTSGGVLVAVGAVALTGWQILDPVIAIVVALNIVWTGVGIIRRSVSGLMDGPVSTEDLKVIQDILEKYQKPEVQFHALRTRQSGAVKIIAVHVLVPGSWTVSRGHKLVTRIEDQIESLLPESVVFTHLESISDPASANDLAFGSSGHNLNSSL